MRNTSVTRNWCASLKIEDSYWNDRSIGSFKGSLFHSTEDSVCAKFAQTADNGKTYNYKFYSLSAIISVGYRINSDRATQFRQWATKLLDLDDFQRQIGSRRLSFASVADLEKILGLSKGSVTPLGILNDEEHKVHMYFNARHEGKMISVHPNENIATLYLSCNDLLNLIQTHSNEADYIELEE